MKYVLTICCIFLFAFKSVSQENPYTEVSYSEFFNLIEEHTDSIVKLEYIIIIYDETKDEDFTFGKEAAQSIDTFSRTDSILVTKELDLTNVHFLIPWRDLNLGRLENIIFTKKVKLINSFFGGFQKCDFKEGIFFEFNNNFNSMHEEVERWYPRGSFLLSNSSFQYCNFFGGVTYINDSEEYSDIQFGIGFSKIWPLNRNRHWHSTFRYKNQYNFWLTSNKFLGEGEILISIGKGRILDIDRNIFKSQTVRLLMGEQEVNRINLSKNSFPEPLFLRINKLTSSHNVTWNQFSNKIIDDERFQHYFFMLEQYGLDSIQGVTAFEVPYDQQSIEQYINTIRYENAEATHSEKKMRSVFYNYYKENQNTEFANSVYTEMKDLETERLKRLYQQDPSFDTFFTLKINQFLKIFSAYGTKPSKAIIFSLYVILAFALIYLFFPNTWDVHGKKRIMHRYSFFMKYMNKKAGINEVYLEEKQPELMSYSAFKELIENSGQTAPRFFKATALPLYKWAISGTKLTARLLSKVDVMKGRWEDVPKSKRFGKSILLIGAFLIAVTYDITIKILNALMLSVNTFTTLGFGEIPIKGLPRYLAIIQGFIGWFMLTIFSVSLISQLLN